MASVGLSAGSAAEWASYVSSSAGLLIPFVVFAGGAAASGVSETARRGPALLALALVAAGSYGLQAYAHPIFGERGRISTPGAVELPFTPRTPGAIISNRRAVIDNPPTEYSRRLDEPLTRPPNRLSHSLHLPVVLAVFAVLNGCLGFLAARLTGGLPPPTRRNARWAVGLGGGLAFFAALMVGDAWVSSALDTSGVAGAWLPLVVPLGEGGVLIALLDRQEDQDHEPPGAP